MIVMVGLDHRRASVEARGRLTFSDERLAAALQTLGGDQWVDEVVILSTCNRTEVYLASAQPEEALAGVIRRLEDAFVRSALAVNLTASAATAPLPAAAPTEQLIGQLEAMDLAQTLYTREGVAVAQHLYEVAAGLRSMVIGEPQILGQTRAALAAAEAAQVVGEELRALFTSALKVGKRVRAETEINRADVSVAGLGVRAAREALGDLRGKAALLIGSGRTNQLSARLLRAEGVGAITIANRSLESAAALAEEIGGRAVALEQITLAIAEADLLISATAAPHTVLSLETVAAGRAGRAQPLVALDLAVPTDIAPGVGALPCVTLLTLDTLRDMADPDAHHDPAVVAALRGRERDIEQAEQIIAEGLREYTRAQTMRLAVPGIAALRRHVDLSEQQELARALAQLDHLSERDRDIIERFGARLVDKMFHHLVRRIRSLAEYDEIPPDVTMRVLAQLFAEPTTPDRDAS